MTSKWQFINRKNNCIGYSKPQFSRLKSNYIIVKISQAKFLKPKSPLVKLFDFPYVLHVSTMIMLMKHEVILNHHVCILKATQIHTYNPNFHKIHAWKPKFRQNLVKPIVPHVPHVCSLKTTQKSYGSKACMATTETVAVGSNAPAAQSTSEPCSRKRRSRRKAWDVLASFGGPKTCGKWRCLAVFTMKNWVLL